MSPASVNAPSADVAAALERLAVEYRTSLLQNQSGAVSLETPIGGICVLVVPHRSEIEVSLIARREGRRFVYPLSTLQSALQRNNQALLYKPASLQKTISVLSDLVAELLKSAQTDGVVLLDKIEHAYCAMVTVSITQDKRDRADQFWRSGDYSKAAELYDELPRLSKLEAKRLELARDGKMPG